MHDPAHDPTRADSPDVLFGELRSALAAPPSPGAWHRVRALLARWPGPAHRDEVALPYAAALLERWPDAARVMPSRWIAEDPPAMRPLWRALSLSSHELSVYGEALCAGGALAPLTQLSLAIAPGQATLASRVCEHIDTLRALSMVLTHPPEQYADEEIATLLQCAALGAPLDALALEGFALHAHAELLGELVASGQLGALSIRDLRYQHERARPLALPMVIEAAGAVLESLRLRQPDTDDLRALASVALPRLRAVWLFHADPALLDAALLRQGPTLRTLELVGVQAETSALLTSAPELSGLESLEVRGDLAPSFWSDLGQGSRPVMHHLGLSRCSGAMPDEGMMRACALWPLRALELHGMLDADAVLAAFAACPSLSALEALSLKSCSLSSQSATWITRSEHIRALRSLSITQCALGNDGVRQIATSPHLDRLTALTLNRARITPDGVAYLAATRALPSLRALDISGALVTEEALRDLLASPTCARLHTLRAAHTGWSAQTTRQLVAAPMADHLEVLDLSRNPLGAEGARALTGRASWPALRALHLRQCQIGVVGMRALTDAPSLQQLDVLALERGEGV